MTKNTADPSRENRLRMSLSFPQVDTVNRIERMSALLMDIWVDDCKPAPQGCAVARTFDDALRMLRRFKYRTLYLDHDLGEKRTGYDLLMVLIEENRVPPLVKCISWNPVGRKRIEDEMALHKKWLHVQAPDTLNGC